MSDNSKQPVTDSAQPTPSEGPYHPAMDRLSVKFGPDEFQVKFSSPETVGTECILMNMGFAQGQASSAKEVEVYRKALERSCWLALKFNVDRYLMSCTYGREDGSEKAQVHREMCIFMMGVFGVAERDTEAFEKIHIKTQELTGYMDEVIGFQLKTKRPNYEELGPKFFKKFYGLAQEALLTSKPEPVAPVRKWEAEEEK